MKRRKNRNMIFTWTEINQMFYAKDIEFQFWILLIKSKDDSLRKLILNFQLYW